MSDAEQEKIAKIRHHYERDERERPQAKTLADVPAFYECITPEWLTEVIRTHHPNATVSAFTLGPKDSGTTNRRRICLKYSHGEAGDVLPRSVFCKAAQDLLNRITMSAGSAFGEVHFYRALRETLPIEAPRAYFANVDTDSYRAIIVMEDIAQTAEFCTFRTPMSYERAANQVLLLARLHGSYYDGRGDWRLLSQMDSFATRFSKINDYHGLEDACIRGLMAAESVMPATVMGRAAEVWPRTLEAVAQLQEGVQTLTHGDVHLGNWYVRDGEAMGLCDFQNLTTGHWSRDLAYALSTALAIEDRRMWERDLVALYLDAMRTECGCQESFEDAWSGYRRQMLSALAWWTVTLTPSPTMAQEMQSKETTLCFLERIGQAIEDLESLDSF